MILLDTNVVSEAMRPDSAPAVRTWLDEQAAETLFLSSVTRTPRAWLPLHRLRHADARGLSRRGQTPTRTA
jgi:predicted nucleic acid-binding protein